MTYRVRTLFSTNNSRTFQGLSRTHFSIFQGLQEGENQANIMPHQMLNVCLFVLYGRIQVGVRPGIFFVITSLVIFVVRLMSGSCHARFLVVDNSSCPARNSLIPTTFLVQVYRLFTAVPHSAQIWSMLSPCQAEMSGRIHAPAYSDISCGPFCKFKAWCLHSTGEVSFLPATSIAVSLYLHHLLENSLGSSTIYSVNWVHKLAGFENRNPCDKFLVKCIVEASGLVPRKPVRKAEPITPEILGLTLQHYGEEGAVNQNHQTLKGFSVRWKNE